MVDTVKIRELPLATSVSNNDFMVLDQTDATRRIAIDSFLKNSGTVMTEGIVFDTVKDMLESEIIQKGSIVSTRGYHRVDGHGGAEYDVWDLAEYRSIIDNPTWSPDGESKLINGKTHYAGGDHSLKNGMVAVLRFTMLWAGQLGLEDPVKDEEEYLAKTLNHDYGLKKAVDYAKKELSTDKSKDGEGGNFVRKNLILHVEIGRYVLTKTCWVGANVLICGGDSWGFPGRVVDFIPLKPRYGGNLDGYVRNYMFIFNGNEDWEGTEEIPVGATPAETIYIAPYVGGFSSLSLNNYEIDYAKNPDGSSNWYAPDYLKGIRGAMVFGGGVFECTTGDRIWQMYHRPGVDWLDYYTDGWRVIDYKCNTPLENQEYQMDFNGSGDVINIEQVQFPVNHPPANPGPDDMWPQGEYPNGVVKGIKLHNWASWDIRPPGQGGSQEMISYVGAGMQIERVINGDISIYGYRQVEISACHMEFGQINLHIGSAIIDGCYFSKITGAKYNSINCFSGPFGGGPASQIAVRNCEFHRGFDGAHYPVEDGYYDIAFAGNYTVDIENCFQGWDVGDNNLAVGITVGMYSGLKDETLAPMIGWDRWSTYLSAKSRIINGKLENQEHVVTWNGFEGIQDVYNAKSSNARNWDGPKGVDLYYFAQFIADIGDSYCAPDFIPLGRNQRERNILDAAGNDTGVRFEAHVFLKEDEAAVDPISGNPFIQRYRPVPAFFREDETPDSGYLRLYRGRNPYQYSEYVDLPLLARSDVNDRGSTCFGRKWKTNPVPFDTNPDLKLRKRNTLPVVGEPMTRYKLWIRGGAPLTLKVALTNDFYGNPRFDYVGTGGWVQESSRLVLDASNKHMAGAEEGIAECITVFDRPFTGDVYVGLPQTGTWNWDNTRRLKFKKGQIATIARTVDTLAPGETKEQKALWVQLDNPDGTQTNIYNMGPGEIVQAVYDEKEVLTNGVMVVKGQWVIGKLAKAVDDIPQYVYTEPLSDTHNLLVGPVTQPTQCLATYDYSGTGEAYASLSSVAALGSTATIVRTPRHTGTLYIMVNDPNEQLVKRIDITALNSSTLIVKRRSGWQVQSTTTLA